MWPVQSINSEPTLGFTGLRDRGFVTGFGIDYLSATGSYFSSAGATPGYDPTASRSNSASGTYSFAIGAGTVVSGNQNAYGPDDASASGCTYDDAGATYTAQAPGGSVSRTVFASASSSLFLASTTTGPDRGNPFTRTITDTAAYTYPGVSSYSYALDSSGDTASALTTFRATGAQTILTTGYHTEAFTSYVAPGATDTYAGIQPPASDCPTVTLSTGVATTLAGQFDHAVLDYLAFGPDEWAWAVTATDPGLTGVRALDELAVPIVGSIWRPPVNSFTYARAAQPAAYTYQPSRWASVGASSAVTLTLVGQSAGVFTGMDPALHPQGYDQLPTPTGETWTAPTAFTTTSDGTLAWVESYSASAVTATDQQGAGATQTATCLLFIQATTGAPCFSYDAAGEIAGTATSLDTVSSYLTAGTTLSDAFLYNYQTSGVAFSNSNAAGQTMAAGSTHAGTAGVLSIRSFLPAATVLEATFNSALRLASSGKFDQITGPAETLYYPFFSRQWQSLWVPLTYPGTFSTWTRETSVATVTDTIDNNTYTEQAGGDSFLSLTYAWSRAGDVRVVLATLSVSDTAAGTTASGRTQWTLGAEAEDEASYFTTSPQTSTFAIGGTQWNDADASAWLGRGLWGMTTHGADGQSAAGLVKVDAAVSVVAVGRGAGVVACKPLPSWEIVTPPQTVAPELAVWTFPRGET